MALTDAQQQAIYQWLQDNHAALTRLELRLGTAVLVNGQPEVAPIQPPPLNTGATSHVHTVEASKTGPAV